MVQYYLPGRAGSCSTGSRSNIGHASFVEGVGKGSTGFGWPSRGAPCRPLPSRVGPSLAQPLLPHNLGEFGDVPHALPTPESIARRTRKGSLQSRTRRPGIGQT